MTRDPFYTEFLPQFGLRYFLGAVLDRTPNKLACCRHPRTHRQGHVDKARNRIDAEGYSRIFSARMTWRRD